MPYFHDLERCDEFPPWEMMTAVGWLSSSFPYSKGSVSDEFLKKLTELQKSAVQNPFNYIMLGRHFCEFCPNGGPQTQVVLGKRIAVGRRNLFVPALDERVYVSPSTMLHYIVEHEYAPPEEFQEAVLRCPPMRSRSYYGAMRKRKAEIWSLSVFFSNIHFG